MGHCMRTGNSILSSLTVLLLITASVSVVSANTLCVSPEIGADNYTSIQEALEHARNGDKILVYPGNYTENVVVNLTDICIVSASGKAADTIIQAEDANESVFYVSADGVKIGGLTIQGSDRAGIELESSDGHTILSNTITGNSVGIFLNFSDGNTIYRNTLEENFFGIPMLHSDDSMVAENVLNYNEIAVALFSGENNCYSKNTLNYNSFGFMLRNSGVNEATGNTIRNSSEGFTLESSGYNSFSKNVIRDTLIGFMLQESENNDFTENTIHSPEIAVIVDSSSDNCFSRNTFTGAFKEILPAGSENKLVSAYRETSVSLPENKLVSEFGEISVLLPENKLVSDSMEDYSGVAVLIDSSDRNSFSENTFTNNTVGFILQQAENNEFTDNCLEDSSVGAILFLTRNNSFSGNAFTNTGYGFILEQSENNELIGNTVDISEIALMMELGRNNKISGNTFTNSITGMMLEEIENNEFSENTISNGMFAMLIMSANNSTISGNEFSNTLIGALAVETNKSTFLNNNISNTFSCSVPKSPSNCLSSCYSNESALIEQNKLFEEIGLLKQSELLKESDLSANNSFLGQRELLKSNQLLGVEEPFEEDPICGIVIGDANNSVLEGNRISDYYYGVLLIEVKNSRLEGNWLENNDFGLILDNSSGSLVYNNYLNNTNNTAFDIENLFKTPIQRPEDDPDCIWNISKTEDENIVGGPYLGGNYWALPDGTGFSQTHEDADKDGICDLPYNITEDGLNTDFLPLANVPEKQDDCGGNGEGKYSSGSSSQKYLPASSSNTEHADSSQKKITAGTEVKFAFREPKNDISKVSFKSKKYSGIVGIRIEVADVNETESIEETGIKAYKYVEILVGNEAFEGSDNIVDGNIEFRVPKNWMAENGINPETISLNRLEDQGWKQLETEITGKDKDFYYFKAKTPGFSCFAVSGKQHLVTSSSEQKAESSEEIPGSEAAEEQADTEEKETTPGFGIILSGAGGLLARACFKRR